VSDVFSGILGTVDSMIKNATDTYGLGQKNQDTSNFNICKSLLEDGWVCTEVSAVDDSEDVMFTISSGDSDVVVKLSYYEQSLLFTLIDRIQELQDNGE